MKYKRITINPNHINSELCIIDIIEKGCILVFEKEQIRIKNLPVLEKK